MDIQAARTALISLRDALGANDRTAANKIALALIEARAPLGKQWKAIANLLQHNNEVIGARTAMALYVTASDDDPGALYDQAAVLAQTAAVDAAYSLLKALPHDVPSRHANAYSRGTMATNLGRFEEAQAALREAVDAGPGSGQTRLALSMAGHLSADDRRRLKEDIALIAHQSPIEQAAWHYALGRLYEQERDASAAFASYARGASIISVERPARLGQDRSEAQQAKEGWTPVSIGKLTCAIDQMGPSRPIFVTGLPRSGTTLVEQILVSHSAVDDGEELGIMRLIHQDIGGFSWKALDTYLQSGRSLTALRRTYERLLHERFPGVGRIVDKTLNSSRSIGLICSLFPDAPIVWVRRDPIDCAWSAYKTWFHQGLDWSWSLTSVAAHFRLEDELFNHWQSLLGERIYVLNYEKLVTNPEVEIRSLLAACGLDFEPGTLSPEQTKRAVTTASVAQVRQGINRQGIGSAEPYREYLQPFVAAYFAE